MGISADAIFSGVLTLIIGLMSVIIKAAFDRIAELDRELRVIREEYVRRDDAGATSVRIEKSVDELKSDVRNLGDVVRAFIIDVARSQPKPRTPRP